ncbi:alcohol dehydrogenase [Actinopolyspora lacussalsi subsp. righensis]|uniref:alcohol dehydrogenase n=1 Tax=Actinopolyspora righensis TaxID=995060 RepID=A0A1I6XDQ0_9ACTN|nr:alcohol dehydrogenase catalytic domain-containing protein [Actinopolyspora righensis]SFT36172.1 alcohol dehydrogenase [Actinopolyspora righensis]
MKAAVVAEAGSPWEIREVPTPEPGPGEVLIRVHASGVCHNDVWLTNGVLPFPSINPTIAGHEAAGEVVAVGAGVTSRVVGDRVGTTWVQGGCGRCDYCTLNLPVTGQTAMHCAAPTLTGMTAQGGHAEYIAVRASSTVPLPKEVAYEHAAPVLCAGYTALSALRASDPRPGDRVAVLGLGGLGHLAVQFAAAFGHEVVAITQSPDKYDSARRLGASVVVTNGEELRDSGGADIILVTGTSYAAGADAMLGLRVNGRITLASIDPFAPFTIDPSAQFFAQGHRVTGASHDGMNHLTEALALVAAGEVTPSIELFDSTRIADAIDRVDKGDVRFRAVITY